MQCPKCRIEVNLKPDNHGRIVCVYCGTLLNNQDETTKIRLISPPPGTGRTMESMTHDLKIQSKYFDAVVDGTKRFETRKNDRMYQVGDRLRLTEILKPNASGEPRTTEVEVTYILYGGMYGVDPDYCIMSIRATHLMEDFEFEAEIPAIVERASDLETKSERLKDEAEKERK